MAGYTEQLGLDHARMVRRISFLNDRADWHAQRGSSLDTACAATARRDAGIIALLVDDREVASKQLRIAGKEFVSIGLYAGYLLQSLSDPEGSLREDFASEHMIARLKSHFFEEDLKGSSRTEDETLSFELSSRQSPTQLLSLYQAIRGRRNDRTRFLSELMINRLRVSARTAIGLSGLPMSSYLRTFDRLGSNDPDFRDRDTLFSIAIQRRNQIDAAREDEFHWRMMLKPAELVDLNLVALGLNALEAGAESTSLILETVERFGIEAALPFRVAQVLHEPAAAGPSFN